MWLLLATVLLDPLCLSDGQVVEGTATPMEGYTRVAVLEGSVRVPAASTGVCGTAPPSDLNRWTPLLLVDGQTLYGTPLGRVDGATLKLTDGRPIYLDRAALHAEQPAFDPSGRRARRAQARGQTVGFVIGGLVVAALLGGLTYRVARGFSQLGCPAGGC